MSNNKSSDDWQWDDFRREGLKKNNKELEDSLINSLGRNEMERDEN